MPLLLFPRQIWLMLLLLPACASADSLVFSSPACADSTFLSAEKSVADGPDYAVINQILTSTNRKLRLTQLPELIHITESQNSAEALAIVAHLRLALSQAQALDAQYEAASKTLKALPLDSSLAPEALSQLAEIEVLRKQPDAAVQWLRQLADLFPNEPLAAQGLIRAAAISSRNSLPLLQESVRLADAQLAEARYWETRSRQTDFLDEADTRRLPGTLWRLTKATLTDPTFAAADIKQTRARQKLQCLISSQSAHADLLGKNPMLLADLSNTVATLDVQLQREKTELANREAVFLTAASDWKNCRSKSRECSPQQHTRDEAGHALTGWRNRITVLEKKIDFLRREQVALPGRWQQDAKDAQSLAALLTEERSHARQIMGPLLQDAIQGSLTKLEEIAAQAHYQLALAQDPRLSR
ncbi:MAG: tetratricopeptide repeat protein [Moraxellaceae bacterium]